MEEQHGFLNLPDSVLNRSPSLQDDVTDDTERFQRAFGCSLIVEACQCLQAPVIVAVTAQHMLHRFFYHRSLRRSSLFFSSMACVQLATKIEEVPRTMRDIVFVAHSIFLRRQLSLNEDAPGEDDAVKSSSSLLSSSTSSFASVLSSFASPNEYVAWRQELYEAEHHILYECSFCFYNVSDYPHKFILFYIRIILADLEADKSTSAQVAELSSRAWGYLNDSMRTDVCLRYPPGSIAAACISLAARQVGIALPGDIKYRPLSASTSASSSSPSPTPFMAEDEVDDVVNDVDSTPAIKKMKREVEVTATTAPSSSSHQSVEDEGADAENAWWKVVNATATDIRAIVDALRHLYSHPSPMWLEPLDLAKTLSMSITTRRPGSVMSTPSSLASSSSSSLSVTSSSAGSTMMATTAVASSTSSSSSESSLSTSSSSVPLFVAPVAATVTASAQVMGASSSYTSAQPIMLSSSFSMAVPPSTFSSVSESSTAPAPTRSRKRFGDA